MVHTIKDARKIKSETDPEPQPSNAVARAAEEVFELTKLGWLLRSRRRRGAGSLDLTDTEFLTLDLLVCHESLTVGQLRKHVGVLPAQMSRILRSLERRSEKPLIRCAINSTDRRRIDVAVTEAGRKAHKAFHDARVSLSIETLTQLPPPDVREFMRIIEKFRSLMLPKLEQEQAQP